MSFSQTNQDRAPDSYHGSIRTNSHRWNGVGRRGSGRPHPSRGHPINRSNSGPPPRNATSNNTSKKSKNYVSRTEKELEELRAKGGCYICTDTGHIARNCPSTQAVKWDGPKPPGIPVHSMQMDLIDDLSRDVLESMPVGVMMLAPGEEYEPSE